jgi:hypothetical protein
MLMLLQPEQMERAVVSYTSTAPAINMEGVSGFMEVEVTFYIRELTEFIKLWEGSRAYYDKRSDWYYTVRNAHLADQWREK